MGSLGIEFSWVARPGLTRFAFSYPAGCDMLIGEHSIHFLSSQNLEVGWGGGMHAQGALDHPSSLLGDQVWNQGAPSLSSDPLLPLTNPPPPWPRDCFLGRRRRQN